jgi:bacterioferritin-associated ferredoxin
VYLITGMIVCSCRGLSDHAIRARLHAGGVGAARQLVDGCGAGADCGSCAWMLEALLDDHGYSGSIASPHRVPEEPACAATSRSSAS